MVDNAQKIAKIIGESGCYFLSLCKIAEDVKGREIDAIKVAAECIQSRAMTWDCFVQDAGKVFTILCGQPFGVLKAGPGQTLPLDYKPKPGEREILLYERPNPKGGDDLEHFVVGDGSGHVAWDPWTGSETVRSGHLASKRIIRRMS